jgi:hypothetical protein
MTSEFMQGLMGGSGGNMRPFVLVAHPKQGRASVEALTRDADEIIRLAPRRGWDCDACKRTNNWPPLG